MAFEQAIARDQAPFVRRLESLCSAFEDEIASQGSSDIDGFLAQVPDVQRPTLLRNLLQIELRVRLGSGEPPSKLEYSSRFPQYSDLIEQEFEASTIEYRSMASSVADSKRRPRIDMPALSRLGDYVIERELGRGGMGVVFAARHVKHGTLVALKTLPSVDGPALQLFKHEFRSLADVNHPNLASLHTLETDAGQWFFTMDLVEGRDFLSYVRPQGTVELLRLRDALSQLVGAVSALHVRGIIHRDLKPSNVMLTDEGSLRVLDFGLVLETNADLSDSTIAGTPAYMAPEQFRKGETTFASDWYSVGVMLYQTLTGKLPFVGPLHELVVNKELDDPPSIEGAFPDDLVELCGRLLSRNPNERLDAVKLFNREGLPSFAVGSAGSAFQSMLVGRERQLFEIDDVIHSFEKDGGAKAIFISGKSGEGKTVLAERCIAKYRSDPRFVVLAGRCYDRESVPFKAIDMIIDGLAAHLAAASDELVETIASSEAALLAELFPVLRRVRSLARMPSVNVEKMEPERVRRLAAEALRELLRRFSEQSKIVCFVDDLQWGDADSAELLLEVFRPPEAPNLLLLGSFRSDEAAASPFLIAWNAAREEKSALVDQFDCRLGPLTESECVDLVVGIVGTDDDEVRGVARRMAEETGRNPFLLSELASSYNRGGPTERSMQIEEIVARKLTMLPPDARALLDVVCVSGQALSLQEASQSSDHDDIPVSTITRMRNERLLRFVERGRETSIDTYHDRIRETVLRDMNVDVRKRLHVRLGETIEAASPTSELTSPGDADRLDSTTHPRVFDLAYHFFEGGDSRGFKYQLEAGEAAAKTHAIDNAIEHLRRAEQVLPEDADRASRYRIYERLGNALGKTRHLPEGLQSYQRALPFAADSVERATILDGAGEMHQRMGKYDLAVETLDLALLELGYRRPRWLPAVLLKSTWNLSLCHLSWLVRKARTPDRRAVATLAQNICVRHGAIFLAKGDMARYADASARTALAALRTGRPHLIAQGLGKLGFNYCALSLNLPGKWMLKRAFGFAERGGDAPGKAVMDGFAGAAMYCLGRLALAEEKLRKSVDVLDRQGESYMRTAWHHNLRHLYSVQGLSAEELLEAEIENEIGETANDDQTICWGQYGIAFPNARMGRLNDARRHMKVALQAIDGTGSSLSEAIALHHDGFVHLQSSDSVAASESLEKSRRLIERKAIFMEYTIHAYPLLVESLVGPNWTTRRDDDELRRAHRLRWRTRFFAHRFPNVYPHSMRVLGRLFAARGRTRKAIAYFEAAVANARTLGHEYQLARALLDLAAVDPGRREEARSEGAAILRRLKAVIPFAEKWQLGKAVDDSLLPNPSQNGSL